MARVMRELSSFLWGKDFSMGLCFVALVECPWPSAAQAIPCAVPSRSRLPSARFNLMRFLARCAAGAVREDFLEASLVSLRSQLPVDARGSISNSAASR